MLFLLKFVEIFKMSTNNSRMHIKKDIGVMQTIETLQSRKKAIQAGITKEGCMEDGVGLGKIGRIW